MNTLGASDSENLAKVQSLGAVAPDDSSIGSECISFAVNSEGRDIVRIILPDHSMKTIFGGVTGNQRINLSAIANSDGSSCTALAHPSTCGPPPPVSTPGSTAPPPDYPSWCADIGHNVWFFAYEWTYDHCQAYFHNTRDLTDWLDGFCRVGKYYTHKLAPYMGTDGAKDWSTMVDEELLYTSYSNCWKLPAVAAARDVYLSAKCPAMTGPIEDDPASPPQPLRRPRALPGPRPPLRRQPCRRSSTSRAEPPACVEAANALRRLPLR